MRHLMTILLTGMLVVACGEKETDLRERAAELCAYIPDHELKEQSKDFMTADFYAVLDTMFNHLPEHEAMDHEWLHYFVTGNGGTIADFEVKDVKQTDQTHAVATISVRQKWEDGSFDETTDVEDHQLSMEKVSGVWLMSDFDGHKQDCIRHIAVNHRDQAIRDAMSDYLKNEIGKNYDGAELFIPTLAIVACEEQGDKVSIWCDSWIYWYNKSGDTLKNVACGNHPGMMTLEQKNGKFKVVKFDPVLDGAMFIPSAKRIFGAHYDKFYNIQFNHDVRNSVRKEELKEYIKRNGLKIRYYKDFGWPAVEL